MLRLQHTYSCPFASFVFSLNRPQTLTINPPFWIIKKQLIVPVCSVHFNGNYFLFPEQSKWFCRGIYSGKTEIRLVFWFSCLFDTVVFLFRKRSNLILNCLRGFWSHSWGLFKLKWGVLLLFKDVTLHGPEKTVPVLLFWMPVSFLPKQSSRPVYECILWETVVCPSCHLFSWKAREIAPNNPAFSEPRPPSFRITTFSIWEVRILPYTVWIWAGVQQLCRHPLSLLTFPELLLHFHLKNDWSPVGGLLSNLKANERKLKWHSVSLARHLSLIECPN